MDRHLEHVIGSQSDSARAKEPGTEDDRILRAKYFDWCSSRIAERFLQLTPDEIYDLAHEASREQSVDSRGAALASGGSEQGSTRDTESVESFRHIVDRVTEALAATIELPPFEEWVVEYRASPARFDDELLGFWKTD